MNDCDLYVMINAYWKPLLFTIQEGEPGDWRRIVDTYEESPGDFADAGAASPLSSLSYTVKPRSVAVLVRT